MGHWQYMTIQPPPAHLETLSSDSSVVPGGVLWAPHLHQEETQCPTYRVWDPWTDKHSSKSWGFHHAAVCISGDGDGVTSIISSVFSRKAVDADSAQTKQLPMKDWTHHTLVYIRELRSPTAKWMEKALKSMDGTGQTQGSSSRKRYLVTQACRPWVSAPRPCDLGKNNQ